MTTDDTDNGWDSLAEDLGLETGKPAEAPEKPPASTPARRHAPAHHDSRPEIEQEAEDFGSGVAEELQPRAALYDPGSDVVVEETEEFAETGEEPLGEGVEGDEPVSREEGGPEEGGKRRRRRRRRRKKGGAPEAGAEPVDEAGETAEEDEATVEEGEAPAPLEGDDEEEPAHSAVDDEMEAEAARPRPEWHVMTWQDLVSKLYRPG